MQTLASFSTGDAPIEAFVQSSLVACLHSSSPYSCCVAVLHGDVGDDEQWTLHLEHQTSTLIEVESLRTGRSAEIGGRVQVVRRKLPVVIDGNEIGIHPSGDQLGVEEQYFALAPDGSVRFHGR